MRHVRIYRQPPSYGDLILQRAVTVIVRRIYLVARGSKASTGTLHLRFIMRILIESGALYLATAIAHFVVWFTPNSFAISVISDMVRATVSLTCTMAHHVRRVSQ